MSQIISTRKESPKPLSPKQSAFQRQYYSTMLDFASKKITNPDDAAVLVHRCFALLFKEDETLSNPIDAMIRLFEIIEELRSRPAVTIASTSDKRYDWL